MQWQAEGNTQVTRLDALECRRWGSKANVAGSQWFKKCVNTNPQSFWFDNGYAQLLQCVMGYPHGYKETQYHVQVSQAYFNCFYSFFSHLPMSLQSLKPFVCCTETVQNNSFLMETMSQYSSQQMQWELKLQYL